MYTVVHNQSPKKNLKMRPCTNDYSKFPTPCIGAGLIHLFIQPFHFVRVHVPVPLSFVESAHTVLENPCNKRKDRVNFLYKLHLSKDLATDVQ